MSHCVYTAEGQFKCRRHHGGGAGHYAHGHHSHGGCYAEHFADPDELRPAPVHFPNHHPKRHHHHHHYTASAPEASRCQTHTFSQPAPPNMPPITVDVPRPPPITVPAPQLPPPPVTTCKTCSFPPPRPPRSMSSASSDSSSEHSSHSSHSSHSGSFAPYPTYRAHYAPDWESVSQSSHSSY